MATLYEAASGSWTYRLYVTETAVDSVNNTSTVTCNMRIYRANSQYSYITNGRYSLQVTINGTTQTSATVTVNKTTSQPEVNVTTLTFTVAHNDDGTGNAQITYCQFISSGGTTPATATLGSMPKNFALTYIPRASDITCTSPVTMAASQSVTVTQKAATFSHILYYSTDDGSTWTEIGRDTATKTYTWSVPDISNSLPNATSATYLLKCETYLNSTYTDTPLESTLAIVANVPSGYVPTVTIGTITEGNANVPAGWPYIVGHSKPTIPTTFTGSHNSTVATRSVALNGETLTSTSDVEPVSLTATKALSATSTTVTATVVDSRGRTGTATTTITAQAYNAPTLEIDCTRCDSGGNVDPLGTYALVNAKWSWTSVLVGGSEANSADIVLKKNGTTVDTYTTTTNSQNTLTQISILSGFNNTDQYTITAEISDELVSSTVSQLITKAQMPLSLFDDGTDIGVTVGRMATQGGLNNWLDLGLVTGKNVNLYDANAQVIDTMTTDDLFSGGGGSTKFIKGTPINLYDTDGTTVLYSRNPENLVFYDGQEGQNVASNFIYATNTSAITITNSWQYATLQNVTSKGTGFEIENGRIKCNKNGTVKVIAVGQFFRSSSSASVAYHRIDVNHTEISNSIKYVNIAYSGQIVTQGTANVTAGDYIDVGVYVETANAVTYRTGSTVYCEYIEDYYITQTISDSNIYSTSEIEIGKWVNNKPIYRKVITGTNSAQSFTVNLGLSNVDVFITCEVKLLRAGTYNQNTNIGGYWNASSDYFSWYLSTPSSNQLTIRGGSDWPKRPYDYAVVLEYTKTTD